MRGRKPRGVGGGRKVKNFNLFFCSDTDGSFIRYIQLLTLMWSQCIAGDFTLVTNALAREYARSEVINQCQGIDQSGDDEMSDDGRQ